MNALRRAWLCALTAALLASHGASAAAAAAPGPAVWSGVERIVAIGDVHGDLPGLRELLQDARLIDGRDRWIGGETHLVQLGDVADRGPDTRAIMDLLRKLEKQARRAGGHVHALIGNHEAMNVVGDLRYVHPGEYAAFAGRGSEKRQAQFYERTLDYIRQTVPEEQWPTFDDAWRTQWFAAHPPGYVEHRQAWAPDGEYGQWVVSHNTLIRINDTLFVHGGLSEASAALTLDAINERIRAELRSPQSLPPGALFDDPQGPLWYRGLVMPGDDAPPPTTASVATTLAAFGAQRVVVGHTPVVPAVVPYHGGRVIAADVGIAAHYFSARACLLIERGILYALHRGEKIALPADDADVPEYLRRIAALESEPGRIQRLIERLESSGSGQAEPHTGAASGADAEADLDAEALVPDDAEATGTH